MRKRESQGLRIGSFDCSIHLRSGGQRDNRAVGPPTDETALADPTAFTLPSHLRGRPRRNPSCYWMTERRQGRNTNATPPAFDSGEERYRPGAGRRAPRLGTAGWCDAAADQFAGRKRRVDVGRHPHEWRTGGPCAVAIPEPLRRSLQPTGHLWSRGGGHARIPGQTVSAVGQGAELLDANANRGTALFGPTLLPNVSRDITYCKAAGVTGLTLGIKLPCLLSSYTGADATRYLTFYESVAAMIRAHRMTVDVELSAAFCGTAYSSCSFTLPDTVAGLATLTAQQARIVIAKIRPNYLTLISADTTEALLTKDPTLDTVAGSAAFVSQAVSQIGPHHGVSVGAGAVTWEPPAFNRALVHLPIDYLDLHIYPIGPTEVADLVSDTGLAKAAHKPVMADDIWLYKEIAPTGTPTA